MMRGEIAHPNKALSQGKTQEHLLLSKDGKALMHLKESAILPDVDANRKIFALKVL
jgi:hypothetical protein